MTTALVFGKFYPPHAGHDLLIAEAVRRADRVIVLVMANSAESIPLETRVAWMTEIHPEVSVRGVLCDLPVDHADRSVDALWAPVIEGAIDHEPIDLLVTSETSYGPNTARLLRAEHVLADPDRLTVPISATMIREDPLVHLDMLAPCVRAHYVRRVRLVGAESTGTTTLAERLAARFETLWVPEYGREYSIARFGGAVSEDWTHGDLLRIAHGQVAHEDDLARRADRLLVCDTDALTTAIWHEALLGSMPADIVEVARGRAYDLTILTGDEIPFVQDGSRTNPDFRAAMQARIRELYAEESVPLVEVTGSVEERETQALEAIATWTGLRPPA